MTPNPARAVVMLATLLLAACGSTFEPPELEGPAALVESAGSPTLWLLSKQEEVRQARYGGGIRRTGGWRNDTFFHFRVQAIDPATAQPLWTRDIITYGDAEASGSASRVIGSAVDGRLLGQEGDVVWLRVDAMPYALDASTGEVIADGAAIEVANPALAGLLPRDPKFLGFDHGLVITTADAQRLVVRGRDLHAEAWVPTPPPPQPPAPVKANGMPVVVPMQPIGPVPLRNVTIDGRWLGLYTENEAADAGDDDYFGVNYLYPHGVTDDGAQARRSFWHAQVVEEQSFDDRYLRLQDLQPIAGSPTFLAGRLVRDPRLPTQALALTAPDGVLIWHATRIDSDGRLALTRLGNDLQPLWKSELPLSESSMVNPVQAWPLGDHLLAVGDLVQGSPGGPSLGETVIVSVNLADGRVRAWNLTSGKPLP